jgi:hypothetical protein
MKNLGIILCIAGCLGAFSSFFFETSVATSSSPYLPSDSGVLNLGLLQTQLMIFEGGLACALAGVILTAAGTLAETFHVRNTPLEAERATSPSSTGEALPPFSSSCEWCDQVVEKPARPCSSFTLQRLATLQIEGDDCQRIVVDKLAEGAA